LSGLSGKSNNTACEFFRAIAQTLEHFTQLPKRTYTRPEEADVTSLLNSIYNFDFVVTIDLYFHLEFKICCIYIFSKRKLV
jgi:hypothetical protein